MSDFFQVRSFCPPKEKSSRFLSLAVLTLEKREDAEILVRMLYYCSEPRLPSQIKSYCEIDGAQFKKYAEHCIKQGLLRKVPSDYQEFSYAVTDYGKNTLASAEQVLSALGIG